MSKAFILEMHTVTIIKQTPLTSKMPLWCSYNTSRMLYGNLWHHWLNSSYYSILILDLNSSPQKTFIPPKYYFIFSCVGWYFQTVNFCASLQFTSDVVSHSSQRSRDWGGHENIHAILKWFIELKFKHTNILSYFETFETLASSKEWLKKTATKMKRNIPTCTVYHSAC